MRATMNLMTSLPSRGAWIETSRMFTARPDASRRSPHGERGLKLVGNALIGKGNQSLPSRGAWIETVQLHYFCPTGVVAPLTGSVD